MALFGSSRDVSFIRKMNREVMGNVISQQCAFYKYILQKTTVNLYGEASGGKFFDGPVLLNALITVGSITSPTSELGVSFDWPMTFAFLGTHHLRFYTDFTIKHSNIILHIRLISQAQEVWVDMLLFI